MSQQRKQENARSNRSALMLYSRYLPAKTHSLVSVFKKWWPRLFTLNSFLVDLMLSPKKAAHKILKIQKRLKGDLQKYNIYIYKNKML